ncbi:hypothetical protein CDD80_2565 [Ophiocordyceps camponoti-rufipedis]|uniref:Uncharacterized protein n=1 Tax=Ophiocordyceps camponoti-rufipedis TaxID=2004952 RepID=A0A2C5ZLC2_9HYPO|nr:hypothetical protein CDD80_2565 [Ophiocordyceps camponoti-rufipedis]
MEDQAEILQRIEQLEADMRAMTQWQADITKMMNMLITRLDEIDAAGEFTDKKLIELANLTRLDLEFMRLEIRVAMRGGASQ